MSEQRRGMIVRTGVHAPLEEAANEILRVHLSGITKHSDKADVLTPWKEQARRSREVYVPSGTPDAAVRSGIYTRSINPTSPHLNSTGGASAGRRVRTQSAWDAE